MPRAVYSLVCLLLLPAVAYAGDDAFFRQRVAPVFERHCVRCHRGDEPKGGLSLTEKQHLLAGGESGPAIVPSKPDESLLLQHVQGNKPEMPKDAAPLPADDVAAIERWIAEGALWPDGLVLTDKRVIDGNWWSLLPLAHVDPPKIESDWIRTPVDAFILAKLRGQGMSPAAEADRRTLIRRLTFDLHGLPPTPDEIDTFLKDHAGGAYERLIDRLLASPRYGERWGRHWLDVVHYGESHGYDKDKPRPNAWPYRDYVIQSFNSDKPYDRFVAEQIAGDVLFPGDLQAQFATGFIAAGPWDFVGHVELREGTVDKDIARSNDRDDMVSSAASTFLSLTVHCARCHDHKFDPIRQQDYYALQAVFAGVDRGDRRFDMDPSVSAERAQLSARKSALEARRKAASEAASQGTVDDAKRSELTDADYELTKVDQRLKQLPEQQVVYTAVKAMQPSEGPRPIHMLARGDVRSPGALVAPAGVACVQGLPSEFEIRDADDEGQRRAALARWLADERNALVRRSIVNRVWQHHFGQGLVDSPNDFGRMGAEPTHPELLEWLAGWFIDHGHSLKELHRLLLKSAVYRQVSADNQKHQQLDAGNRFLWRMNRARLDAECIRDDMLAAGGRLDLTMGGPSVQQFFFKDDHSPVYDYARFEVDDPRGQRRSVYRFLVRSVPDPFMDCLDCADPSILTPKRNTTLTSIQALALLNNPFCVRQAEHFAKRLRGMHSDLPHQIAAAYQLALCREPTPAESVVLGNYAKQFGLEAACRVIFNSNEFVFID